MTSGRDARTEGSPVSITHASLADRWYDTVVAIVDGASLPDTFPADLLRFLHLVTAVDDEAGALADSAHTVGADLGKLCTGNSRVLAATVDLLGAHLPALLAGADEQGATTAAAICGHLAAGYLVGSRGAILREQETSHRAVLEVMWGAQQALFASEKRFRAVFDATVVGMVLCDLRGRITFVNPAMLALIDQPLHAVLGCRPDALIRPTDRTDRRHLQAFCDVALRGHDEQSFEGEYQFLAGQTLYLRVMMSLVRDDLGEPDYVVLLVQDLSDRRASELADRRSGERIRQLIQNSSDMVAVITQDATIEFVSPTVERMLGYDADGLIGTSFTDLVMGDGITTFRTMMDDLHDAPRDSRRVELRVLHRDNTWRWLEMVGTNLVDVWSLAGIVINARDITDRKTFELQLERQAYYDALTALPNRLSFRNRLEGELALSRPVGVLFMDLDRFKMVNDSLGHGGGDQLLVAVGQRILDTLVDGEFVARFGGDEFAVLVPNATISTVRATARRIRQALQRPVPLQHRQSPIETSIGIAVSDSDLSTSSGLLRAADVALYRAKSIGGGTEMLYEPTMLEESVRRFDLETDLHNALANNQLDVYYQPIVHLASGQTVAVEATLRWDRPGAGVLAPQAFRQIAEEIGLLAEMESWLLARVMAQLAEWRSAGLVSPTEFQVKLGLTKRPRDLKNLVYVAERLAREFNIHPRHLCINLHPRIEWSTPDEREAFFAEIRRIGIGISVTVYAEGNDTLLYLRRGYADTMRIDPSFLAEQGEPETDAEIVASITGLARKLGTKSIALGIDSGHAHRIALEIGVMDGQGTYLGAAEPAEAFAARLAQT